MKNNYNKFEPKIYQTEYGTWKVKFFDAEIGSYVTKNCRTKSEASNLKRALARGDDLSHWFPKDFDPKNQINSFGDVAEKWMEHGKFIRQISDACLMNYKCHLRHHILPIIGEIHPRKLKMDHIEKLAKSLLRKTPQTKSYQAIRKNRLDDIENSSEDQLSIAYQREILTVACMITSWASSRKPALIFENPFEGFQLPKAPEQLYDYWRIEDEDQFLDWLEAGGYYFKETTRYHHHGKPLTRIKLKLRNASELRDIVLFALRTGIRLGEIGAIRNADVNLAQGFLIARASYSTKERKRKSTTKSKKPRRIEINADVREILERRQHKPQKEPLFNIHMNSIKFFSRTCRWAGVREIHFHSLRHTCLTNLANGYGMKKALPIPKVQQIAGHSDIKTTMRYVHNDIINETASLQLSRTERKLQQQISDSSDTKEQVEEPVSKPQPTIVPIRKGLRLVHSK